MERTPCAPPTRRSSTPSAGRPIVAVVLDEGDGHRRRPLERVADSSRVPPTCERSWCPRSVRRGARTSRAQAASSSRAAGRPGYHEALVRGHRLAAAATSSTAGSRPGAAIAGRWAIVGGWRRGDREICAEEAGEDLEQLTVLDGLGLVPFAVDVHATQWGTLTRLAHAVRGRLAPEGWAVDEGDDADL